jgi:hypothetical protein
VAGSFQVEAEVSFLTSKNIKRLRTERPPKGRTYMKTRYILVEIFI